jgi:hypothetical protein
MINLEEAKACLSKNLEYKGNNFIIHADINTFKKLKN